MKKRMFSLIKRNILFVPILFFASFNLCGCAFGNKNLNVHDYRFYLFLSEFNLPNDFIIEIQYFQKGETVSRYFERPMQENLFYVDIPSNLEAIYLNIIKPDYGYYLKDYPVRKIHYNVIYDCHSKTYRFDDIKYVNYLNLSCRQFADYILSTIDPSSDSYSSGFNAYNQINSFFYSTIIDSENISNTFFFDRRTGKEVTVERRMEEIKQKASKTPTDNEFTILAIIYFSFAIVFMLPLLVFMLCVFIKKIMLWKRKGF